MTFSLLALEDPTRLVAAADFRRRRLAHPPASLPLPLPPFLSLSLLIFAEDSRASPIRRRPSSSSSCATILLRRRQGSLHDTAGEQQLQQQGALPSPQSSRHASVVGGLMLVPGSSPVQMPDTPAAPNELTTSGRCSSSKPADVGTPQVAHAQQWGAERDSSPTKIANRLLETMTALHSKVQQTDENARPEQLLVIMEHLLHISGTKDHTNAVWSFVTNMVLRASYLDADISASEDTGALTRGFDQQLKTGLTSLWRRLHTDCGKGNGTMPTKTLERVLEHHSRRSKVDAATNTDGKVMAEVQTQTSQDEDNHAPAARAATAVKPVVGGVTTATAETMAEETADEYIAIDGGSPGACSSPAWTPAAAVVPEAPEVPLALDLDGAVSPAEAVSPAKVVEENAEAPWAAPPPADDDHIKVFVRVRPEPKLKLKKSTAGSRMTKAAKAKIEALAGKCAESVTDTMIRMSEKSTAKSRGFTFDSVLGEASTQDQIFGLVGKDVVENCLNGYNGTIFAYAIYLVLHWPLLSFCLPPVCIARRSPTAHTRTARWCHTTTHPDTSLYR